MPVRSIYQWKMILQNLEIWNAVDWLLRDLMDYPVVGGQFNEHLQRDRDQLENFLTAFSSVSRSKTSSRKTNGPIPVIDGDLNVTQWRAVLSELNAASAAECVIANVIFDAAADYGYCVLVLKRVLTAWGEIRLREHGLGVTSHEEIGAVRGK